MSEREQIENLEKQLTGVFFDDLYINERIHYLERNIKNKDEYTPSVCSMEEGCDSCGS